MLSVLKGHPRIVVPVKAPVKAMKTIMINGDRRQMLQSVQVNLI